jgi:CheY-like chemotaxis protein
MNKATAPVDSSLSVLVIDEEPSVLALLSEILAENGIRALLARNASEAVEVAGRSYVPIDLVLTDVQIPGATGAEVLARIRASRPNVRGLYMAAFIDSKVIRIDLLAEDAGGWRGQENRPTDARHETLVENIRRLCQRPLAERVGSGRPQ